MKKAAAVFFAVLAVFSAATAATAANYVIAIPYEVSAPGVVTTVEDETFLCGDAPVIARNYSFYVRQWTPTVTSWNAGSATLSGINSSGFRKNFTSELEFSGKVAYIKFASQECQQLANWDTCEVSTEFACDEVKFYLQKGTAGSYKLYVPSAPYLN